jgi:hypothetical protein
LKVLTETKSSLFTSIGTITYVAHIIFENIVDDKSIVWAIFVSLAMPMMSMFVPETVFLALIASFSTTEAVSAAEHTISARCVRCINGTVSAPLGTPRRLAENLREYGAVAWTVSEHIATPVMRCFEGF